MKLLKQLLKWLAVGLGVVTLATALFLGSLRFSDGPVEFFPWFTISIGGPFKSGELTLTPDDWSFLTDREEIQFQTLTPNSSRTVWLAVHDKRLFIVSGYMNSGIGKLWKQWPVSMEEDNRVILRIDDALYEQSMRRILEGPEIVPVMSELSRKYGNGAPGSEIAVTGGFVWMFEVMPR